MAGLAAIVIAMTLNHAVAPDTGGGNGGRNSGVFRAADFGVVGDGVTDDGPAIARLIKAASGSTGARVVFEPRKTYYIGSAASRYVFHIAGASGMTLDGQGSTFELGPHVRFMRMVHSKRMAVRRFHVDFRPLPFADGDVVGVDAARRRIEVRIVGDTRSLCGGPTRADGEQAFFGMLWSDGPYGVVSRHYWLERTEQADAPDRVWAYAAPEFTEFADLGGNRWRVSLPVPGIAHRYGPGACFMIRDNDGVSFEDVELWSAPWMGFEVARNSGEVTFRRVHVRPKPGSGRLMSTCRDGFHVKGNRGRLLWDGCIVTGMTDDAFNISTHCSEVSRILSADRIEVRQRFPLLHMPWRQGAELVAVDPRTSRLLGVGRVREVHEGPMPEPIQGEPAAPVSELRLESPVPGLAVGSTVWDRLSANPNTTLRRCRIEMSCRMQSPVTMEGCDVTALLWFYSEPIEGPYPGPVVVRNCTIRRGRGNPAHALIVSGGVREGEATAEALASPRAIRNVTIENNRIYGGFVVEGVEDLRVVGNRFLEPGAPIRIETNHRQHVSGNADSTGRAIPQPASPSREEAKRKPD